MRGKLIKAGNGRTRCSDIRGTFPALWWIGPCVIGWMTRIIRQWWDGWRDQIMDAEEHVQRFCDGVVRWREQSSDRLEVAQFCRELVDPLSRFWLIWCCPMITNRDAVPYFASIPSGRHADNGSSGGEIHSGQQNRTGARGIWDLGDEGLSTTALRTIAQLDALRRGHECA